MTLTATRTRLSPGQRASYAARAALALEPHKRANGRLSLRSLRRSL